MWLIETESLKLEFFDNPEDLKYAILSHTWGSGEVSFQEMANLDIARTKPGFSKIERTCKLARDRGLRHAWVDTCCIDKSSSAELTEAINSMFRWYKASAVCFVYLSDLPPVSRWPGERYFPKIEAKLLFSKCRWFTRGWTLQELIASKDVEFYDQGWHLKGDKVSLGLQISTITGIDKVILENSDLISTIPVARRMSWASKRQTTRVEDLSYCLFGIFDVHLPLIYGEGMKAFLRLQEAIALENNDLSLFAWTSKPDEDPGLRGIFALHPSEFQSCGALKRVTNPAISTPAFSFTNKGFHITTRLREGIEDYLMDLQCIRDSLYCGPSNGHIFIRILKTADGFVRQESDQLKVFRPPDSGLLTEEISVYIPRRITPIESQQLKGRLFRNFGAKVINMSGFTLHCNFKGRPDHLWDNNASSFITDDQANFMGILAITLEEASNPGEPAPPKF